MYRYAIIEDEPAAKRRLQRHIHQIRPSWELTGTADSVKSGIEAINEKNFDLIFCDIQLSDGDCFEIFKETDFADPVIFITAFDEYAIQAFDFNSIHYLLKPIRKDRLLAAIQKFERNKKDLTIALDVFENTGRDRLKNRILTRIGNKTRVINVSDAAFFYYSNRMSKCVLKESKECTLDKSLNQIMEYLPDSSFFRINRQVVVAKTSVLGYSSISSNRLLLQTAPPSPFEFIVSKERAGAFRKWLQE